MIHAPVALSTPHVHAVAVHGLIGQPLAVGIVLVAFGAWLWHHEHRFQRFTLWLFTAGVASLTVATPMFLGALVGEVWAGPGLTVLFVAIAGIGTTWWLVAVRTPNGSRMGKFVRRKAPASVGKGLAVFGGPAGGHSAPRRDRYRRIASVLVALSAGPLFVVVYGMWKHLLAQAATSARGAASALLQSSHQVSSGQAAKSVPQSSRPEILIIAAVLFVVAGLALRHHEKRKHRQQGGGRGGGGNQPPRRGSGVPGLPVGGSG